MLPCSRDAASAARGVVRSFAEALAEEVKGTGVAVPGAVSRLHRRRDRGVHPQRWPARKAPSLTAERVAKTGLQALGEGRVVRVVVVSTGSCSANLSLSSVEEERSYFRPETVRRAKRGSRNLTRSRLLRKSRILTSPLKLIEREWRCVDYDPPLAR